MRKFVAFVALSVCAAITLPALAQKDSAKDQTKDRTANQAKGERITLNIEGVECGGCAKVLTTALNECKLQISGKLEPNKDGPSQIVATCDKECDLSACAAKIAEAKTPHREQAKPGMCLVLFSKLDEASAKEAVVACRKIKGADGTACKADVTKGEIHVKLTGEQKITPDQIVQALRDAGISAQLSKSKDKDTASTR